MNEKNGTEAEMPKLGARLRQRREALELSVDEVGRRLHLPHQVITRIENDDVDALGAPVFVRGYLRSYARLLGMPESEVESSFPDLQTVPPPLVATGTVPLSQRLLARYARQSLYIVLTAVTVLPILYLAVGGHFSDPAQRTPLDAGGFEAPLPSLSQVATTADSAQLYQGPPAPGVGDGERRTVMASLLPPPRPGVRAESVAASSSVLQLVVSERSWVEVHAGDGSRLEFAMLPAGAERSYPLLSGLSVRIGNAAGVTVDVDGRDVDLHSLRRANVAHFRVSSEGDVQPVSGG